MGWAAQNIQLYLLKLFCWLTDQIGNASIHDIANNHCPTCIISTDKLSEYLDIGYPARSYKDYTTAYT